MSIVLEQLTKRYEGHAVVNHVSLEVSDGEFFVLLGPSGSGKSTVLRMIAGLSDIEQGRVMLQGRDVTRLPPQQRGVGFVFQHYALFQHMSVAENIEFGLRIRKVAASERRRRRDELLELVGLAGLGGRMPSQLSGGQQQRVALARALAYRPEVLLLDEPFGALDAKIRIELRRALRRIQRELGMTTIFVTHDQEEAFELADRLGVMHVGRLLEVGPSDELYQRPQTEFVASFLGTANLLLGQAVGDGVRVGPLHFPLGTEAGRADVAQRVQVLFRPEEVVLAAGEAELNGPPLGLGVVEHCSFAGVFERLRLRLPPLAGVRPIAPPVSFGSDGVLVEALRAPEQTRRFPLQPGDTAWVGVRRIHALAHPGMRFLFVTDGSPAAQAALDVGGQIARLAHARVTVVGHSMEPERVQRELQQAREQIGGGLPALETCGVFDSPADALLREVERQPYDLVVLDTQPHHRAEVLDPIVQSGEHHLLLVPRRQPLPTRVLICVAMGEPGKEGVLFSGRLLRHVGAEVMLLTVQARADDRGEPDARVERFLSAGARTLALLGVRAQTCVRYGAVRDEILAEMAAGGYDMLVLGAPLTSGDGRGIFAGVVGQILGSLTERVVLIVRSSAAARRVSWSGAEGRIGSLQEVV